MQVLIHNFVDCMRHEAMIPIEHVTSINIDNDRIIIRCVDGTSTKLHFVDKEKQYKVFCKHKEALHKYWNKKLGVE